MQRECPFPKKHLSLTVAARQNECHCSPATGAGASDHGDFQNTTSVAFSPLRTCAPRSCHCWYVPHSPRSYPFACAAAHRQTVLMPRYGFLLVTLTGEHANLPEVCQGIRHVLTPASIALMIWDVTRAYTSCFSVAVISGVAV